MENLLTDYSWAEPYPELKKACTRFDRTELLHVTRCVYTPLVGYLQQGPQCGLVALAMLVKSPRKETVDRIFEYAKKMGFSNQGEIFSAAFMAELAEKFFENARVELHSGELDCDKIKEFLLDGGLMLVPYDNAKNFSPALYNGTKAHWCAISGALQTVDDFHVIARQGKSLNVAIWKLRDLSESNAQLTDEFPKTLAGVDMVQTANGLNKKAVLVYPSHKSD